MMHLIANYSQNDILQSKGKLRELKFEELESILLVSEISILSRAQRKEKEKEVLVEILHQVYQWPLGKMTMYETPSYADLLDEFDGLHGLNVSK